MVVIRLSPGGRKNQRIFHVCVADKDSRLTGRYIDKLGQYNEVKKSFVLDQDKYKEWLSKGAIPSTRLKSLIKFSEAGTLLTRVSNKSKLRAKKAERSKAEAAKAATAEAAPAAEGDKAEA